MGAISLRRRPESLADTVCEAVEQAMVDARPPADSRVAWAGPAERSVVSSRPVR